MPAGSGSLPEARVMLVAAHPDDEIIGAGSRLAHFRDLVLVHVTDGAPRNMFDAGTHGFTRREDYAAARRNELLCALKEARCTPELVDLCVADQETTANAAEIARRLAGLLRERSPGLVLTHAYEGGHPDHDATALAVHLAVASLNSPGPALYEFASYHARNGGFHCGDFLPHTDPRVITFELSPHERTRKQAMLDCFITQRDVLKFFRTDVERFRIAPSYDFTIPPHEGRLYYERFDWGMQGGEFRSLARNALKEFGRACV
jgi:LmbE family N-acetylglucosaminyl deacetylase